MFPQGDPPKAILRQTFSRPHVIRQPLKGQLGLGAVNCATCTMWLHVCVHCTLKDGERSSAEASYPFKDA